MTDQERIIELEKENAELKERLQISIQMSETSKKQEVLTLKNDISDALKLDYADFIRSKERPCDEDLFIAYRFILTRIFKLLKRYGINCQ